MPVAISLSANAAAPPRGGTSSSPSAAAANTASRRRRIILVLLLVIVLYAALVVIGVLNAPWSTSSSSVTTPPPTTSRIATSAAPVTSSSTTTPVPPVSGDTGPVAVQPVLTAQAASGALSAFVGCFYNRPTRTTLVQYDVVPAANANDPAKYCEASALKNGEKYGFAVKYDGKQYSCQTQKDATPAWSTYGQFGAGARVGDPPKVPPGEKFLGGSCRGAGGVPDAKAKLPIDVYEFALYHLSGGTPFPDPVDIRNFCPYGVCVHPDPDANGHQQPCTWTRGNYTCKAVSYASSIARKDAEHLTLDTSSGLPIQLAYRASGTDGLELTPDNEAKPVKWTIYDPVASGEGNGTMTQYTWSDGKFGWSDTNYIKYVLTK